MKIDFEIDEKTCGSALITIAHMVDFIGIMFAVTGYFSVFPSMVSLPMIIVMCVVFIGGWVIRRAYISHLEDNQKDDSND